MTVSAVALDVPASPRNRSFGRLLLAVVLGYVGATITLSLGALVLFRLWALPRPWVRPGPFPIDGAWSFAADVAVAAVFVLVTAWWIRRMVEGAVRAHVSLGVVALAFAITGYLPYLVLPGGLFLIWEIVALVATTWAVRRYAIRAASPIPKLPWRISLALVLVGLAVLGSYRVYHPLTAGALTSGDFTLMNSDWADMTILSVDGGSIVPSEGWIHRLKLPYTLGGRKQIGVSIGHAYPCRPFDVVIKYSILGLTTTQRFRVTPDAPFHGSFSDVPSGAGCNEYP